MIATSSSAPDFALIDQVFDHDVLLPAQLAELAAHPCPCEARLFLAVLADGIDTYLGRKHASDEARREAGVWIFTESHTLLGFDWACAVVGGLDAEGLRRGVRAYVRRRTSRYPDRRPLA